MKKLFLKYLGLFYILMSNYAQASSPTAFVKANYTFSSLIKNSHAFLNSIKKSHFPIRTNTIAALIERIDVVDKEMIKEKILNFAKNSYPILHHKTQQLIADFITYKKTQGNSVERILYTAMTQEEFITRLLTKRPLVFYCPNDIYLLRDGTQGSGNFETIGTKEEQGKLILNEYLSYDELKISALLGVSTPSFFINNGNRINKGTPGKLGSFEQEGIIIGQVGARFEKEGLMEWQDIIITKKQNTPENSYGIRGCNKLLDLWADFYEIEYFPTYAEAQADTTGKFIKIHGIGYLNKELYKKRMRMIIEPFLIEANNRGAEQNKQVYVSATGLGLGVWKISDEQINLLAKVYAETVQQHNFTHISDIDFSCWTYGTGIKTYGMVSNNDVINNIKIHITDNPPQLKLSGPHQGKLLVTQYAWDAGSFPGNEYYLGELTASGDPAAACGSMIQELQNPYINPAICGKNCRFFGT